MVLLLSLVGGDQDSFTDRAWISTISGLPGREGTLEASGLCSRNKTTTPYLNLKKIHGGGYNIIEESIIKKVLLNIRMYFHFCMLK